MMALGLAMAAAAGGDVAAVRRTSEKKRAKIIDDVIQCCDMWQADAAVDARGPRAGGRPQGRPKAGGWWQAARADMPCALTLPGKRDPQRPVTSVGRPVLGATIAI